MSRPNEKEGGQMIMGNLPQVIENIGEPWRSRTPDPLIKSAVTGTPSGCGSYDSFTFVTDCSRQLVHLLPAITPPLRCSGHKLVTNQFLILSGKLFVHEVAEYRQR